MAKLGQTPSQTVGPYYTMKLKRIPLVGSDPVAGERIRVEGRVLDGDRNHIEDALIEIWQANAAGRYRHPADTRDDIELDPGFTGYGRFAVDFMTGRFAFETIKPGQVPDPEGEMQAPHLSLVITSRGMLNHSYTRMYFADEAEANAADLILQKVPPERHHTIIAERDDTDDMPLYRFDIRFQGDDETVFFDV